MNETARVSQESLRAISRAQTAAPLSQNERLVIHGMMLDAALKAAPDMAQNMTSYFQDSLELAREDLAAYLSGKKMASRQMGRTFELLEILDAQLLETVSTARSIISATMDFENASWSLNPRGAKHRYDAHPFTALTIMKECLTDLLPQIQRDYPDVMAKALKEDTLDDWRKDFCRVFYESAADAPSANPARINSAVEQLMVLADYVDKVAGAIYCSSPLFKRLYVLRDYIRPYKTPHGDSPLVWKNSEEKVARPDFTQARNAAPKAP